MSTAPNDEELFNFTQHFETAAKQVIDAALGGDSAKAGESGFLSADHVISEFQLGKALDRTWRRSATTEEYFMYEGNTLTVTIAVPREDDFDEAVFDSKLNKTRAKLRTAFSLTAQPFADERLSYYRVYKCQPAGETRGISEQTNCDTATLTYDVSFFIKDDAWPVLAG